MANTNPTQEELAELISYNGEIRAKLFDSGLDFSGLNSLDDLKGITVTAAKGPHSYIGIIFGTTKAIDGTKDDSVGSNAISLYNTIARIGLIPPNNNMFKVCDWSAPNNMGIGSVEYGDMVTQSDHLDEGKIKLFSYFGEETISASPEVINNFTNGPGSSDFKKPYILNLINDDNILLENLYTKYCFFEDLHSSISKPNLSEIFYALQRNTNNNYASNTSLEQAYINGDLVKSPLTLDSQESICSYLMIYNTFTNNFSSSDQVIKPFTAFSSTTFPNFVTCCAIDIEKLSTYFASDAFTNMKNFLSYMKVGPADLKVYFLILNAKYNTPEDYDGISKLTGESVPKSWLENDMCTISNINIITN